MYCCVLNNARKLVYEQNRKSFNTNAKKQQKRMETHTLYFSLNNNLPYLNWILADFVKKKLAQFGFIVHQWAY